MIKKAVEKRHKCNKCGAVRYESRMIKLKPCENKNRSQWGNDLKAWACRDRKKDGSCW